MRSFDFVDAVDFFGRERLVERLIARLGLSGARGRFIAVVGPSGSGKSSAVKAGLLPAIRSGGVPLSGSWFTIEMTPANQPFEQLEEALRGVAVNPPPSLLEQLAGDQGLQRAVNRVLPPDGSQLLLLIDQFEELYTQVDPATANRFLDNLVGAVTDEQSRIRIVATLRADFYDRPLQHQGLGELLRDGTEIVTPMAGHDLERAITCPAEPHGITFEPAVVAALVLEVTDRPSALPLLQYTLTELFDHRRGDRVDYATYEELGGLSGTLVKRAEGLLASLGHQADEVARQVFLRLVMFNDGGEDTRRRVLRSELEDLDLDQPVLHSVLDTFGRHRLLSFDRDPITRSPTVEISHEALLTVWTRLRNWIDRSRNDVRLQRRLAEAQREWAAANRADTYLLRGGVLEQLHGWSISTSLQLSGPEQAFLDASVVERDREAAEILRRENRTAVAERRQRQRGLQLVAVGLVTILVAALAVFGTIQWRAAADAKRDVDDLLMVNRLVTASRAQLDRNPELALLLAMQSLHQTVSLGYATEEAVDAMHFALQELGVQYDVGQETPVVARPGSHGPVGVYVLPPNELMELAQSTARRTLTDRECREYLSSACPAGVEVPDDLEMRGGLGAYGAGTDPRPLAGTTVSVFPNLDADQGLAREFAEFRARTGINVELTAVDAEAALSIEPGEPNRRPDIYIFAHEIPAWAQPRAIDVGQFVDTETLRTDFGDYLLGFGKSDRAGASARDGAIRAIPVIVAVKGVVFYPKAEFRKAGYDIPETWAELIALSDRIVADGGTPWCFGFESGIGSGWPGTDLIESLVLRVGGVDVYDAWARGEIGFASPAVTEAGGLADELVFTPGYVRGGAAGVSDEVFSIQLDYMFLRDSLTGEAEPECWLHHQADFMLKLLPASVQIGTDIDFFVLPPIDPAQPTPTTGTPGFASALVDRPEVREFMEFLASPEFGKHWAVEPGNSFISPNARFDLSNYGDLSTDPGASVRMELAQVVQSALQSGTFRIDASDLMPLDIGGSTVDGGPGAFWRGMLDWVDGVRTIDEAFADIDAEWAAWKAQGNSPPPES